MKRSEKTNPSPLLSRPLLVGLLSLLGLLVVPGAVPSSAVRFGPPKPVCDRIQRLEQGGLFMEVLGPDGEAEYRPILTGRTDPIVLDAGTTYRLGLTTGQGAEARVPARYRIESRSFLTLAAYGTGEAGFPLEREYSWNTYDQITVVTRAGGRRALFLRVSECYTGGSRFLYAPSETLIPVVVRPEEER